MAITRCPYCHAIIDENDKYCNNCGTQLLFSEDDEVEEEIPGDKIIDAEVEEKDYTIDEPEGEKRPEADKGHAGDAAGEADGDLEEELAEEPEEMALDDLIAEEAEGEEAGDVTEEVILVDEIEASEARTETGDADEGGEPGKSDTAELRTAGDADEGVPEEDDEDREAREDKGSAAVETDKDEDGTVEIPVPLGASDGEPEVEYITETPEGDLASTAGESALRPVTFDTRDLEDIGRTVEIGREKIDKFLEDRALKPAEPPVPPTPLPMPDRTPTAEVGKAGPASGEPPTGTLPPWASTMKGAPAFPDDTGPVEAPMAAGGGPTPEEVEIFPRRRGSDSTIGLPERVTQAPLPFEREPTGEAETGEEEEAGEEDVGDGTREEAVAPAEPVRPPVLPVRGPEPRGPAPREAAADEAAGEAEPGPPFSFSVFFKSKAFDALFVGVFWLVALWLAAHSMDLTLFEILGGMSGSMVLLYAALLGLYVFLFRFFLGETLGDRLFRPRE